MTEQRLSDLIQLYIDNEGDGREEFRKSVVAMSKSDLLKLVMIWHDDYGEIWLSIIRILQNQL